MLFAIIAHGKLAEIIALTYDNAQEKRAADGFRRRDAVLEGLSRHGVRARAVRATFLVGS